MNKTIKTPRTPNSRINIAEEAATWFVRLREEELSPRLKQTFTDWLTESPVHVEEYLAIAQLWGELAQVDSAGEIDIDQLVDTTVVSLGGMAASDSSSEASVSAWRRRAFGLVASVLFAVMTASVFFYWPGSGPLRYHTGLGEQLSVVLEDGSTVSLNTLSTIEVQFDEGARRVRLLEGEALFEVKKDVSRPFFVNTNSAMVRVTGTKFNVYEQDGGTAVTVIEGAVMVVPVRGDEGTEGAAAKALAAQALAASVNDPIVNSAAHIGQDRAGSAGVVKLGGGDQARVKNNSVVIETRRVDDLEPVLAWTERRLVFDATPLSSIVLEFNRYNRERFVIQDSAVAELALSGVFSSNDPQSLILFLERMQGIELVLQADGSRLIVATAGVRL